MRIAMASAKDKSLLRTGMGYELEIVKYIWKEVYVSTWCPVSIKCSIMALVIVLTLPLLRNFGQCSDIR